MVLGVGFLLLAIGIILSLFSPVIYTENWEFGKITGIGNVYKSGTKTMYDLFSLYGVWYIIFSIVLISTLVLLIIFYKKKMLNFYISIPFMLFWIIPIAFMYLGRNLLETEGKFVGNDLAIYGSGTNGAFSTTGYIIIFLTFISIVLIIFDEFRQKERKSERKREIAVKSIKPKKEKEIEINDFKM